jgi:hypothetical protein
MKIIQHADCFEVRSEDGSIVRQLAFDDDPRRRAISRRIDQETSLPSRKDFCRQSYTVETAKPWQDWNFADTGRSARSRKGQ